jgi:beta-phosphoglucomutase
LFGMDNHNTLSILLGDRATIDLITDISVKKELEFRKTIRNKATLLPGVERWLQELKQRGVAQAIASSASQENIDALIDELRIRVYFDQIVSGQVLSGKPAPDIFLNAAKLLGVAPSGCVVLEDSVAGVVASRRAGMHCIAIAGSNPAEKLGDANLVISSLEDLPIDLFFSLIA